MKSFRIAFISFIAVASASASFAGPGLHLLQTRRAARLAQKEAVTTPVDAKCHSKEKACCCEGKAAETKATSCKTKCGS